MTTMDSVAADGLDGRRPLSERLLAPIHLVSARQRLLAVLLASFQCVLTIGVTWLVLILLLGSFRNLPVGVAMVFATVAWLSIFGGLLFFRAAFRRHDLFVTARLIDEAVPETHERISSALELSEDQDARYQGSPELVAVLLRQAEHAAERLDASAILSGKHVFRWFLGLIPLLLVWFVLFVVITPTIALGTQRLLQPWQAAAPLPTAKLEVDPQNVTIAQGDRVTITVGVTPVGADALTPDKPVAGAMLSRRYAAGNANEDVTAEMERTGNRTFRTILDNVQQTFSYHVSEGGGQSAAYTVTVLARPAADSVQIDYTFPAYTHRAARTETTRQGAIDGLVGTVVKVTVAPNQAVKSATLTITDNAPDPSIVTLMPLANNRFSGQFTIKKSTDYRLHFFNEQGLENADTQARAIIARLDTPPQVTISSPTDAALKVRPDDVVPIKYAATDDFGLTRIELITEVDGRGPVVRALPLEGSPGSSAGAVELALHALAGEAGVKRIAYSFRATDNRAPEPQVGLSGKQVLLIDGAVAPLAARQDAQAARTLADAIRSASANVNDAKTKLDQLRKTAASRALTEAEKQQAGEARRDISNAAQALESAADKSTDSRLAEAARRAKGIAEESLRGAQENAAASQLAADQPEARNKALDGASTNLAEAQKKLGELGRDIGEKAKDQPLAHELERIAAEQRRLAEALAQHPNDPTLLAQQKQLQQDLEKVIKDHPELQQPAAQAAGGQVAELQKKVDDLREQQRGLNDQAKSQTEAAHIQDKLSDLSKQQEELHKKIDQFNAQQANNLRQANAKTPDATPLNSVGKDLQDRKLSSAAQSQNATAAQLEETARQLEAADKRKDVEPKSAGPSANDAKALKEQADQLQQQIGEAQKNHNPPTRPSDPANQEAARLAEQVRRGAQQAQQNPNNSAAEKQAAQQAATEAEAAKREAAQGNAAAAQQHLASATSSLQQATQNGQSSSPSSPAQTPGQAAQQARDLAQQQRALAEQTQQANKSLETAGAAQENAPKTAEQQQQLAEKMEEAAKSARELQQKTQGSAPEMAQRAAQTAESLEKAAAAQRSAAKANQSTNPGQAAQQQQQSSEALSSAQKSMGGQGAPSSSGSSGAGGSGKSASGEGAPSGEASAAGKGSSPGQGPGSGEGSGAGTPTAQAVQSARDAQSQAASGNPVAARQAAEQLTRASEQLLSGGGSASGASPTASASGSSGSGSSGGPGGSGTGTTGSWSGGGIALSHNGARSQAPMPKDVENIGVSPSDWARLPAASQEQLVHAAQQSGPPAYRDMIKNYYSRIAHLDDGAATPQGGAQ